MKQELTLNWFPIYEFTYKEEPNWYYVLFDHAYIEEVFFYNGKFYKDEACKKRFLYEHEIQWITETPDITENLPKFPNYKRADEIHRLRFKTKN
tara:strand:+ start:326 stop:607 length:282 start_codon:yes stop_codon:yes gene_type:complete